MQTHDLDHHDGFSVLVDELVLTGHDAPVAFARQTLRGERHPVAESVPAEHRLPKLDTPLQGTEERRLRSLVERQRVVGPEQQGDHVPERGDHVSERRR